MFTGLIETIGKIRHRRTASAGATLFIDCAFNSGPCKVGESIAVDGVCVTVTAFNENGFAFDLSSESLRRSCLGNKSRGAQVHLERALRVGDRLGGHIVQGHVDGMGRVASLIMGHAGGILTIELPEPLRHYVVEKGSLAVQGVSLTVSELTPSIASCAIVPATIKATYLADFKPGEPVNLEVDIIAKYTESLLHKKKSGITEENLKNWGF